MTFAEIWSESCWMPHETRGRMRFRGTAEAWTEYRCRRASTSGESRRIGARPRAKWLSFDPGIHSGRSIPRPVVPHLPPGVGVSRIVDLVQLRTGTLRLG